MIMRKYLTEDIEFPHLLWNWDTSQFIVDQSDNFRKVCTIKVEELDSNSDPLSLVGNEALDIRI